MSVVPAVTDLDALLAPISEENPVGEDLRSVMIDAKRDQAYWHDKLREARREDPFTQIPKKPDWEAVINLATQALTKRTKDLQLAAWLTEALVGYDKHDRLAGLRDGIRLVRGLIEQYWDQVFPLSDPEDPDGHFTTRANVISVLEASLASAIKQIPLTNGRTGLKLSFNQWEESKRFDVPENAEALSGEQFEKVEALKKQAADEAKTTSESWRKSHQTTSYEYYKERLELLNESWDELQALDDVMDERFQREAPGVRSLRKSLDEVR
ncbi:MAG: type VI secretion system ImpA family N-terminal domain-containing protein, partial [Acidobacteria bacterium]|nr:type VI secretion system ImpA family N-terminal domain-containing protein [Acidobacteriota bacterium]